MKGVNVTLKLSESDMCFRRKHMSGYCMFHLANQGVNGIV